MRKQIITELDLKSGNDIRFAEAVSACSSGDPQTCVIDGKCALNGDCFACVSPYENKTAEDMLEVIKARDDEIRALYDMHKNLMSKIHAHSIVLYQRYLMGVIEGSQTVFAVKSSKNTLDKIHADAVNELECLMQKNANIKGDGDVK